MYVVTADQRGSRDSADAVPRALELVRAASGSDALLGPERTVGDELQVALGRASTALRIVLDLTRERRWSVGLGVGHLESPPPSSIREARGTAFVHARSAVERAKRAPGRLAVAGDDRTAATDAEALIRLLIEVRDRRSPEGWEVHDLLSRGMTQREVADALGVTPAAVSLRARAAALRIEDAAIPALERELAALDR